MTTLKLSAIDIERSTRARKLLEMIRANDFRWGQRESETMNLAMIEVEMLGMERAAIMDAIGSQSHTSPQCRRFVPLSGDLSDMPYRDGVICKHCGNTYSAHEN